MFRRRLVVKPSLHAASRESSPSLTSLTPTTHSRPTCDRCLIVQAFDISVLDIDMIISRRAPLTLRYFHWRRLRGQTSNTTLVIALWERHHLVANSAVERMIRAMFRDPSFNKEVVKAILQQWKEYIKFRKQRADVLWIHHKQSFQGEWLVDDQDKAEGVKPLSPELIFEPSVPVMSLENLPWVQQGCRSFSVRGRHTTPRVTLIKLLNKES
ncbi:hypothetical protein PC116_g10899 [Phytophthora cactorum]|uniref:Uncharacterized protein n=1 Tax=Phytophthora cactorum TaxID=29920 RepID=A0A8T1KWL3_9STRA|nr:hypothetical protein PC114_g23060 [Phytophthora cactorum]KAG2893000.1 hypothetical protein PC117_g23896 [Phytophthora cactorum]KAG2974597.1 hypothetical protein PC119_g22659 [Phytophthora cactorum]KAG4241193.1 hypothetical protein PC116_g10899 [Phytophthora cactorum]